MDDPTCREVFLKLGYNDIFDSLVVSEELGYVKPARVAFKRWEQPYNGCINIEFERFLIKEIDENGHVTPKGGG